MDVMEPFLEGRQLVGFWDDWLSKYHMRHLTKVQLLRGAYVVRAVQRLGVAAPRILDIGCAHGWLCAHLASFGSVTGVDMSEKGIEAARALVPSGTFAAGDFVSMSLPEDSFDVITCLESIAYMDQPAFIAKARRLLRPGGTLIVTTPNWPIWQRAGKKRGSPSTLRANHLTMETLGALVSRELRIVRTTTLNQLGLMGLFDSVRAHALLKRVIPESRLIDLKGVVGALGRGSTLFVVAQKV
jgi:2-polyprenyl-3-methyl-5-hydroxy-6-metoxy-1,4-benzoquinol methylase